MLTGLPAVFSTPGDQARTIVPAPGIVTITLVMLQLAAAVPASWTAWPMPVAIGVTALCPGSSSSNGRVGSGCSERSPNRR